MIWIVMENRAFGDIVGSREAPYINLLTRRCGLATRYHGITHPSLPNYVAMVTGSTVGVTDDDGPSAHRLRAPSIFSQLGPDGWRALEESMPAPCARSDSGSYAVRHNPAAYFPALAGCAARDVALGRTLDLSARFTFVTPNLVSDMHDGPVAQGDAWLERLLSPVLNSAGYRAGRTAVFITWDEDDGSAGNRVALIAIAPSIHAGTRATVTADHRSLLRTTEAMLGLPALPAAAGAPSLRQAFGL